ncbi:phosphodiester glycosidase family protein [Paenibacillus beijingensis]|uniref:Copper amine oxidase n=1 Tax=Paenibacillus beijingensis TaxID=1126833 RepID=A0A0D5NNR8_9BACL|nr:phosphodiester glycosidase family protein [Paenibacillus beijingensis]AJY76964.1 copper amine oxidase [Paenibacillus beijingensis]
MKKIIVYLLAVLLSLTGAGLCFAKEKQLGYTDPQTNRTFVPIRLLSDYAGAKVTWNEEEKRIDIVNADKNVTIVVGEMKASINGAAVMLESPPFTKDGITYVPLKFVSFALGIQLEWKANISAVLMTWNGQSMQLPVIKRGSIQEDANPIIAEQRTFKVGNKTVPVHMVTVSLLDPRIDLDIALAGNEIGKVEELKSIASRNGAILAINGTFFDAYTTSENKNPYGYLVNSGKMLHKSSGDLRTIFLYDRNNFAELIAGADFPGRFRKGTIDGALQAGPRLLLDGKVDLNVKQEGFRDPKILTGGGARSALGITRDHKLILLTSSGATIPQLASIMKQAGAFQAMNLDGGASSGLYYDGKYITAPGRQISNAILVKYV